MIRIEITSCRVCPFRDGAYCKPYERIIDDLDAKLPECVWIAVTMEPAE